MELGVMGSEVKRRNKRRNEKKDISYNSYKIVVVWKNTDG